MTLLWLALSVVVQPHNEKTTLNVAGDWRIVSYKRDGVECVDVIKNSARYYFTEKTMIAVVLPANYAVYRYTISPQKDGQTSDIDLVRLTDFKTYRGIIIRNGSKLTICISNTEDRPIFFDSDSSTNRNDLTTLEKE